MTNSRMVSTLDSYRDLSNCFFLYSVYPIQLDHFASPITSRLPPNTTATRRDGFSNLLIKHDSLIWIRARSRLIAGVITNAGDLRVSNIPQAFWVSFGCSFAPSDPSRIGAVSTHINYKYLHTRESEWPQILVLSIR